MEHVQALMNGLIESMLPRLNTALPAAVRAGGLDPYEKVTSRKQGGGRASATYRVRNLEGLASIELTELRVTSIESHEENDGEFIGDLALVAMLNDGAKARLKIEINEIFFGISTKGRVRLSDVTLRSKGYFAAVVNDGQVELRGMAVRGMTVDYGDMKVSIGDMAGFKKALKPLRNSVLKRFKGEIRKTLARELQRIVNRLLDDMMPQHVSIAFGDEPSSTAPPTGDAAAPA